MKLPNAENAYIAPEKLAGYLLNLNHRQGGSKARYLANAGITIENVDFVMDILKRAAIENEVNETQVAEFGIKYKMIAEIPTLSGRNVLLFVSWQIDYDKDYPRFLTAFPI